MRIFNIVHSCYSYLLSSTKNLLSSATAKTATVAKEKLNNQTVPEAPKSTTPMPTVVPSKTTQASSSQTKPATTKKISSITRPQSPEEALDQGQIIHIFKGLFAAVDGPKIRYQPGDVVHPRPVKDYTNQLKQIVDIYMRNGGKPLKEGSLKRFLIDNTVKLKSLKNHSKLTQEQKNTISNAINSFSLVKV